MTNTAGISKIEREPLHDKVYGELKQALMEARFEPGSQLSLRELAAMFGVSVAPVRAALLRLLAEKAVVQSSATNSNFYVPELAQDDFEEIIQLRSLLEGMAAERAAASITQAELKCLEKLAVQLDRAAEAGKAKEYLRANRDFKFLVLEASRSPVLYDLVESLWMRVGPLMHLYARNMSFHREVDHYSDVVAALSAGDAEAARQHLASDVLEGGAFLRQQAYGD